MSTVKHFVAAVAVTLGLSSAASAATIDQFVPVAGGETASISTMLNGISASQFSGFGLPDFATISVSDVVTSFISIGFPGLESLTLEAVDEAFGTSAYEGLYAVTGGSDAAAWGDWALVNISGPSGVVGFNLPATMSVVEVAPIPLPAGGLLLVTALVGLGIARRKRAA